MYSQATVTAYHQVRAVLHVIRWIENRSLGSMGGVLGFPWAAWVTAAKPSWGMPIPWKGVRLRLRLLFNIMQKGFFIFTLCRQEEAEGH